MKMNHFIVTGLMAMLLSGCSNSWYPFLYHPTLSQGNVLNANTKNLLKIGMNKAQVVNIMGMPILQTPFAANTWHYVYVLRRAGKMVVQRQITLHFSNEILTAIE